MEALAKFDINEIIKGFEYQGEFLDKSDLGDLLNNYTFNNKDELIDYLNDDDGNYIGDTITELADSKIDCYYHSLREWAVDNYHYIEDAISEFGVDTKEPDFHKMIQQGQFHAFNNEFYTLVSEFKDYIESLEFKDEDEEA